MDHVSPIKIFSQRENSFLGWIMSSPDSDGNVRTVVAAAIGQIVAETVSDKSLCPRTQSQVSTMARTCPSATTSSRLTRMDLSLPAAGEATGISIFIASTNATSSPSPTLPPTSTGSAQTRPATSVTILMSGIPLPATVQCSESEVRPACGGLPSELRIRKDTGYLWFFSVKDSEVLLVDSQLRGRELLNPP